MPIRRTSLSLAVGTALGVAFCSVIALGSTGVRASDLLAPSLAHDPANLLVAPELERPSNDVELVNAPQSVLADREIARDHGVSADSALLDTEYSPKADLSSDNVSSKAALVDSALALVGVRYRRGGETPATGLDCSGLVRYVFHDAAGRDLPHRALELSRLGVRVARDKLKPGDMVFFNTLRRAFSHVGIYIGDGQFVHAPATGGNVRVESLDIPYWTKRFNGARRIEE